MERLSIDDIITHCEEKVKQIEGYEDVEGLKIACIDTFPTKMYWEHRQAAEYLKELKEYRKLGTVEELKNLIAKEVAERRKLEEYLMLGSVEELRNLVNNDLT